VVKEVCNAVEKDLKPGITTSQIFRKASRYLAKRNLAVAAKYNLKRGIAGLGPAGFLFEQFVETLLQALGYRTSRNKIMKGKCVTHEIDVVAHGNHENYLIEAKYRNKSWIKTHIDVVMYADARLQDIKISQPRSGQASYNMWLVTNTKFTKTAIRYANCKNLKLTGWNYPKGETLEELIAEYSLYPITVLPSLNRDAREALARRNMMLARDLAPHSPKDLVKNFGIRQNTASRIIRESHALVYSAKS